MCDPFWVTFVNGVKGYYFILLHVNAVFPVPFVEKTLFSSEWSWHHSVFFGAMKVFNIYNLACVGTCLSTYIVSLIHSLE